ncbi:hypothetical protein [Paenibacillus sp. NRS-1760]
MTIEEKSLLRKEEIYQGIRDETLRKRAIFISFSKKKTQRALLPAP